MTHDLIDAAIELADALARENEALTRGDLQRVAAMLAAKQRAAHAFSEARRNAPRGTGTREGRSTAADAGRRLNALARENRRLLERALRVQGRVIGTIADALSRSGTSLYQADGATTRRKVASVGFVARA